MKAGNATWPHLYDDVEEIDSIVEHIEGAVPADLQGTLYRNGPGKRRFASSFFDGDGMLRALRFPGNGKVHFQSAYIRTPKFLREKKAGKKCYRTAGSNLPGGMLANAFRLPANEVNTSTIVYNNTLLAMEEGGRPFALRDFDLQTLGEYSFNKQLSKRVAFSAHPHICSYNKHLYNFGMMIGPKPAFQTYQIDPRGKLTNLARIPLHHGMFAHDFALSGHYLIFFLSPLRGNMRDMILGKKAFFDTLEYNADLPTEIVLVPRDGSAIKRFEVPSFLAGHIVSARDDDNDVFVDMCCAPDEMLLVQAARCKEVNMIAFADSRVRRFHINIKTGFIEDDELSDLSLEFPRIHPDYECQSARWAYFAGSPEGVAKSMYRAIVKLNRDTGDHELFDFGEHCIAWEPVFVPRRDGKHEDDGWLIAYVHNGNTHRTDVAIFDARSVDDGPVALLHLPINAGTTFHGWWQDE